MDEFVARARADLEAYVAESWMALSWGIRPVSDWAPYAADAAIELPLRKNGTGFSALQLRDRPDGILRFMVRCPFERLRRSTPAEKRRIVVADLFGAELGRLLTEGAELRAENERRGLNVGWRPSNA